MLQPKKRICKKRFVVEDITALHRFANTMLTPLMQRKNILFLRGDLGAGKTTFVRALMQAAGYQAPIQSPTYGIVHSYQLANTTVHHFDCYRIRSEEELWDLGLEDYLQSGICIVEWPEHGMQDAVHEDISITMHMPSMEKANQRIITLERFK